MRYQVQCDCGQVQPVLAQTSSEAEQIAYELASEHQCVCRVRDITSGAVVLSAAPMSQTPERGSPPSTYAILAALRNQPGAWPRIAAATGLRALMIMPGLWMAGAGGWRLVLGSAFGSASVTAILFAYYAVAYGGDDVSAPDARSGGVVNAVSGVGG